MDINNGDITIWGLLANLFSSRTLMVLAGICLASIFVFIIVCIIRAILGSPASFFGISVGERPKGNRKLENKYNALKHDFDILDAMSEQTNTVMQLLSFLVAELQSAVWYTQLKPSDDEIDRNRAHRLWELIFEAINTSLSTGKHQYHRFGVFVLCDDGSSMMLDRYKGFGTYAAKKLRLSVGSVRQPGSVAGRCYLHTKQFYIDDVTKESSYTPNPKSTTEYRSLACTPIICGSKCVAVLSVDAKKVDAFCKEDLRFMEVFAGMISLVMFWESTAYNNDADREAIS